MEPLTKVIRNLNSVDLIFQEGTLEGLTNQLMINKGEMLQVANESETFFNKLYSQKGYTLFLISRRKQIQDSILEFPWWREIQAYN